MNKPWTNRPNDHDYFDSEHVSRFLRNHCTGTDNRGRIALGRILFEHYNGVGENQSKVLDAACGTGVNFEVFRNLKLNISYTGLDCTQQFVDHANRLYSIPGEQQIFQRGFIQELPFKENDFDVVILRHIFEHLPPGEMEMVIQEAMRVASKEVILVYFLEPHNKFCHEFEHRSSNIEQAPEVKHWWNTYSWPQLLKFFSSFGCKLRCKKVVTPGAAAPDFIVRLIK